MSYRSYRPNGPLANLIASFWLYEGSPPQHQRERVLPTGCVELSINLQDSALHIYDPQTDNYVQDMQGPLIGGPRSRCFIMDTSNQAATMGLHFKPAGAASFFKVPVGELRNALVPREMLWGGEAWDLQEQLFLAATPADKFQVLEQALFRHLPSDTSRHPVVSFALKELQRMVDMLPCIYSPDLLQKGTIAALVEQTGISHRRFVQLFTEATGLTPKLFWRIQRFQLALRLIRRAAPGKRGQRRKPDAPHRTTNWSEIALACGYFDQAHFIHDFQAFSGTAPTAYLAAQGESMNHVPYTHQAKPLRS